MLQTKLKPAFIMSIIISILATFASIGGLLLEGLYRDNAFVKTTWLGNDVVTLFLAVPILIIALVYSARGLLKAHLVWMGMLDYMLYNYAFYLFGAAFNWFFLVYAALTGLSIIALIFGLANLDLVRISNQFREKTPVRWIGGYFLFVGFGLALVYVQQSIAYVATGALPAIIAKSGHITNVVFALDLTLLIPWFVVGALWLMKRNLWGFVIAGILSIKGPLYTFVLLVNTILSVRAGLDSGAELPLWATLTAAGLVTSGLLYGNMRTEG